MRLLFDVASRVEDPYLRHAVALAERARGATAPNPLVGCVVVREGRIVGEGYHPRAGEAHAEVFALRDAGEQARGADVYVTLEPCRHHGRTPPCTEALIAAGVSRVVIGMADPTAEAGGGAEILRQAGIEVDFAENPSPFVRLNEGWIKRMATGVPFVTAKLGLSLDARVALVAGERASVTGASGREVTRWLRSRADAVLVGTATVASDDPALTVRGADGTRAERQPLRVVLVRGRVPHADARVFADAAAPTLVLASDAAAPEVERALAALPDGVLVERYPEARGLLGAFEALGSRGIGDVLVEPGPRLLTALWDVGLVDELVTVTAGGMAGAQAPSLYERELAHASDVLEHRFAPAETGIVGDVTVTAWRPAEDADATESD